MRNPAAAFRPTDRNQNRINLAKTLGVNISEFVNELMEKHADAELKKRMQQLQKEMERAKGFEPSTFTLARCGRGLKLTVRVGNLARDETGKVPAGWQLSDSSNGGRAANGQPATPFRHHLHRRCD
jgi:hypothetical protein